MSPRQTIMELAAEIEHANREHFDKVAVDGGYDNNPFVERVSRQIADTIKQSFHFDEESTILLDYACGTGQYISIHTTLIYYSSHPLTGQMSRNLAPYTKKIIGIDISKGMVDYYNQRVYNQGIPQDQMQALCVQLTGADTDLDGQKFDVIVVSESLRKEYSKYLYPHSVHKRITISQTSPQ
jgi:2-polyprenyl-3-methyl-5-hydroxy-6-metoxy-1,4-benzoquinol methylase